VILDAGVLAAIDRNERSITVTLQALEQRAARLTTSEPVVAQVWRDGARQARLARFLQAVETVPLGDGRTVGALLGRAGTSDVVDAHLVVIAAQRGDDIVTGGASDLGRLCRSIGAPPPRIHPIHLPQHRRRRTRRG
jgi:hypothetical protein